MKITITSSEDKVDEYNPSEERVVIGRSPDVDITIQSDHISREHLVITEQGSNFHIENIASSNNWVSYNGDKLEKNEPTLYYSFSELMLPGGYIVKIEAGRNFEVDAGTKTKTKTRTTSKSRKTQTKSLREKHKKNLGDDLLLESPNDVHSIEPKGRQSRPSSDDGKLNTKTSDPKEMIKKIVRILIIVLAIFVVGYFVYDFAMERMVADTPEQKKSEPQKGKK